MSDVISMLVEGKRFTSHKSITISRSLEALCGSFSFPSFDQWAVGEVDWEIVPGSVVQFLVNDLLFMTGYVDKVEPSVDATSHTVTVSGRDMTCDLVDCSAPVSPGTWRNLTLYQIAKILAEPYGISVQYKTDLGEKFVEITNKGSETVYELLSRLATSRNLLLLTDFVGNLVIDSTGAYRAEESLVLGKNVLSVQGTYDFSNRFSHYECRGNTKTQGEGWGAATISVSGKARDDEVLRYRPLIIQGSDILTRGDAERKAKWASRVRAAKASRWNFTLMKLLQNSGALWAPNLLVDCEVDAFGLSAELLIVGVTYSQSESGTTTNLTLSLPDSYEAEPDATVKVRRNTYGW